MKKRDLTSEETELWRRTMRDVKKFDHGIQYTQQKEMKPKLSLSEPRPVSLQNTTARRAYVSAASTQLKAKTSKTLNSVVGAGDPRFDKRVSRRRMPIDRRLDLHGLTQAAAEVSLRAFLAKAMSDACRCVLVITGKGGGPTSRGVLHSRFSDWVNGEALKPYIARVAPAHQKDGGAGAWYVFLKRRD